METEMKMGFFEALPIGDKDGLEIFRKIIDSASTRKPLVSSIELEVDLWERIFPNLLDLLAKTEYGDQERSSLIAHSFFTVFWRLDPSGDRIRSFLDCICDLENGELLWDSDKFSIRDSRLFQLICFQGFLQSLDSGRNSSQFCGTFSRIFENLYEDAIGYRKYSYICFRILQLWLEKTGETDFWASRLEFEEKLESLIFANWENSIKGVGRQNASVVFRIYLETMSRKYGDAILRHFWRNCLRRISWRNETKHSMLAEILLVWESGVQEMVQPDLVLSLLPSLTSGYLQKSGRRLYLGILKRLTEEQWREFFSPAVTLALELWEYGETKNYQAVRCLCRHWLEPAIDHFGKDLISFLHQLGDESRGILYISTVAKIGASKNVEIWDEKLLEKFRDDECESVRCNVFSVACHRVPGTSVTFHPIQHFLYFDSDTVSVNTREEIRKSFRIFCQNLWKSKQKQLEFSVCRFFQWLKLYFLDCFEIGSSYQRKILGLQLYRIFLEVFFHGDEEGKKKKGKKQKSVFLQQHLENCKNCGFLSRPFFNSMLELVDQQENDLRGIAADLISRFFPKEFLDSNFFPSILAKIDSHKFYECESGAELMRIYCDFYPEMGTNGNYLEFLKNRGRVQLQALKTQFLTSALGGCPFFGTIMAISKIAFDENNNLQKFVNLEFLRDLMALLEESTEFFLSILAPESSEMDSSPSFAEMGMAIDEIVRNGLEEMKCDNDNDNDNFNDNDNENDRDQFVNYHQIVISCIWMSLKVSCETASEIGRTMISEDLVAKSTNLIIQVLLKCRHKGVMEAAGVSLGNLIRTLCSSEKYEKIPEKYLLELLSDTKNRPNLTRRSAGHCIMLHKSIAADKRRDKPLLHAILPRLLESLENWYREGRENEEETRYDLPSSRFLHFLRALVADKELHSDLVSYLENICLIALKYLESRVWPVRNASLQLYGALVPRLVGQCVGDSRDFGFGYSVNHFTSHFPKLAETIFTELLETPRGTSRSLEKHSRIVYFLTILSRLSFTDCRFFESPKTADFVRDLKSILLRKILENPVVHVRVLAAKTYAAFTPVSGIQEELVRLKNESLEKNVNFQHGILLVLENLRDEISREWESDFRPKNREFLRDFLDSHFHESWIENHESWILEKSKNAEEIPKFLPLENLEPRIREFPFEIRQLRIFQDCLDFLLENEELEIQAPIFQRLNLIFYGKKVRSKSENFILHRLIFEILQLQFRVSESSGGNRESHAKNCFLRRFFAKRENKKIPEENVFGKSEGDFSRREIKILGIFSLLLRHFSAKGRDDLENARFEDIDFVDIFEKSFLEIPEIGENSQVSHFSTKRKNVLEVCCGREIF